MKFGKLINSFLATYHIVEDFQGQVLTRLRRCSSLAELILRRKFEFGVEVLRIQGKFSNEPWGSDSLAGEIRVRKCEQVPWNNYSGFSIYESSNSLQDF
jgi:hypothetical protein